MTGEIIFNTNKMVRGVDPRPVVLVESDADQSVIAPHLRSEVVRTAPGFSKTATLLAAELHLADGDTWVVSVVDRDLEPGPFPANVIATQFYDLEAELFFICPDRVDRVTYSHLISESISHDTAKAAAAQVRRDALEVASVIGIMRRHSAQQGLGVSFADLPIAEIVRQGYGTGYASICATIACSKAKRPEYRPDLERAFASSKASSADLHCNGHDLLRGLCVFIGRRAARRPNDRDFARGLHASIDCNGIRSLSIFDQIRQWLLELQGDEPWGCVA